MRSFVACVVMVAALTARAEQRPSGADPAVLLASAGSAADVPSRLERATAPLLGLPYGDSPLGEGEGSDPDPRVRWDVFDCLTFVETAMALAASQGPADVLPILDDIRYMALPPRFAHRNHFVESQWLHHNRLKGWVRDVTRSVGGPQTKVVSKEFTPERWAARRVRALPLEAEEVPRGVWRLDMIGLQAARELAGRMPPGALLFVVRRDFYTEPTRITHVGLIVEKRGRRYLRHASRTHGRVVDEPLVMFLDRNAGYTRWPVEGVSLWQVQLPEARVETLRNPRPPLEVAGHPEAASP